MFSDINYCVSIRYCLRCKHLIVLFMLEYSCDVTVLQQRSVVAACLRVQSASGVVASLPVTHENWFVNSVFSNHVQLCF